LARVRMKMSNESSPQTQADVPRVDLRSEESIRYWCDRWQVKPDQLRLAVEKAGDDRAPAVAFALGREAS
jgi:Protein of unknown function (DUF3606)